MQNNPEKQRRLNVAYIIPRFYPFKGGAESNIEALAIRMAEEGHKVTVITTNVKFRNENLHNEEIYKGIKIIRNWTLNEALYAGFYPGLLAVLVKNDFDIVHASGIGFIWREMCLTIKKILSPRKTKFIVTPHGPFMALGDNKGFRGFAKRSYTLVLKVFIPWLYDSFIAVNPKQQTWMSDLYRIPKEKAHMVPNGINKGYLENKLKTHEKDEKVVITYMNRMEWYKGVQDVLKAFVRVKRMRSPLPEFEFLIMGRAGGYTAKLKQMVQEFDLKNEVQFIFAPTDEERDQIFYEKSQINILPSKWEATGIALLEAMAKGNVLITTKQNEASDLIIEEGINGFTYDFQDIESLTKILRKLLLDHELRQKMREHNLKNAKNYTWDAVFPTYLNLIHNLTGNSKINNKKIES